MGAKISFLLSFFLSLCLENPNKKIPTLYHQTGLSATIISLLKAIYALSISLSFSLSVYVSQTDFLFPVHFCICLSFVYSGIF